MQRTPNRHVRRRRALRQGQALVEMALVLPVVVGLMVAVIEFGSAWRSYQVVTHVAREAARISVLPTSDEAGVRSAVEGMLHQAALDPERAEILLALQSATGTSDTVIVNYPIDFILLAPIVEFMRGDSTGMSDLRLSGRAVMRNE